MTIQSKIERLTQINRHFKVGMFAGMIMSPIAITLMLVISFGDYPDIKAAMSMLVAFGVVTITLLNVIINTILESTISVLEELQNNQERELMED